MLVFVVVMMNKKEEDGRSERIMKGWWLVWLLWRKMKWSDDEKMMLGIDVVIVNKEEEVTGDSGIDVVIDDDEWNRTLSYDEDEKEMKSMNERTCECCMQWRKRMREVVMKNKTKKETQKQINNNITTQESSLISTSHQDWSSPPPPNREEATS
jgi:hypothetical protein